MSRWKPVAHATLLFILGSCISPPSAAPEQERHPCPTFDWDTVPSNQWVQLPTCRDAPRKVFHGASALASDRNIIFFFGADTHKKDYDNSVYRLTLSNLEWLKDYEPDPIEDYRLTKDGYAVTEAGRPWAMHAFDVWDYAPSVRKLMTASSPQHAYKAFELLSEDGDVRDNMKAATWLYDPDTKEWQLVKVNTPYLFGRGQVWDPLGQRIIAHHGDTTSYYDLHHQEWVTYEEPSVPGWHRKLVFDTFAGKVLSLGHTGGSRDLWRYSPTTVLWEKVVTPNQPLPANGAAMAYDTQQHVLVYLANDSPNQYNNPSGKSVTFVYSSEHQTWERLSVPSPPLYGMNYLMQYDLSHHAVLHFEKAPGSDGRLAVWAFRYRPMPGPS